VKVEKNFVMQKKAENKLKRYLPLGIKKLFFHYWIKSFLVLFCSSIAFAQDLPISLDDSTDFDIEIIQDSTEVLLDTLSLDAEFSHLDSASTDDLIKYQSQTKSWIVLRRARFYTLP
jgi:hypothetical protein